jgi:hypothetical protein
MTAKCGDHDGRTDDRCNLCVLSSFIISHFNCMHCNLSIFFLCRTDKTTGRKLSRFFFLVLR